MDHYKDHSMFGLGLPGIIYYITVEFLISIGIWSCLTAYFIGTHNCVFLVSYFFSNVVTSSCGGSSHQQNDLTPHPQGSLINVTAEGSVAHCWPDHGRADCCQAKIWQRKTLWK